MMQTQAGNQHQPIGRLKQVYGSVSEFDGSAIEIKKRHCITRWCSQSYSSEQCRSLIVLESNN